MSFEIECISSLDNILFQLELKDDQEIVLREKISTRIRAALESQSYPHLPVGANPNGVLGFYQLFIQEQASSAALSLFLKVKDLVSPRVRFEKKVEAVLFKATDRPSELDIECIECSDLDEIQKVQSRTTFYSHKTDFFALLDKEDVSFESLTNAMLQTYEYQMAPHFKNQLNREIYNILQYTFLKALNHYDPKSTKETFGEYFVRIWDKEMKRTFETGSDSLEIKITISDREATQKIIALKTMIETAVNSPSFQEASSQLMLYFEG